MHDDSGTPGAVAPLVPHGRSAPDGRSVPDRVGRAAAPQRLSIGAVLAQLQPEFPEISISKIRFLEAERLVEPERTPSGYRKFSPADVERLAYVLRMQRDHYLPLRVIRDHLAAVDRGETPPALTGSAAEEEADGFADTAALAVAQDATAAEGAPGRPGRAAGRGPGGGTRLGRAELIAAAEISERQLADWESFGLVGSDQDGCFDAETVPVARLIAELGRFGLEPRHLRAVRAAADREVGLVEQIVAPLRRHRNPQTRSHAAAMARELASLSVRLHAALVQSGLRRQLGA